MKFIKILLLLLAISGIVFSTYVPAQTKQASLLLLLQRLGVHVRLQ